MCYNGKNVFLGAIIMIKLDGKVVIITGGGRGIGFGLSTAFAKAGAKLVRGGERRYSRSFESSGYRVGARRD